MNRKKQRHKTKVYISGTRMSRLPIKQHNLLYIYQKTHRRKHNIIKQRKRYILDAWAKHTLGHTPGQYSVVVAIFGAFGRPPSAQIRHFPKFQ